VWLKNPFYMNTFDFVCGVLDLDVNYRKRSVVAISLGSATVGVVTPLLLQSGLPYSGDFLSNMLPPLHARHSIRAGKLPIYTDLWYGGRYQPANPLWKGLYPPAWPMFVPWVPLETAAKVVFSGHLFASGAVAGWLLSRDFRLQYALPLAIVWAVPALAFRGHLQMVLAWPWAILIGVSLLPWRISNSKWSGLAIGIGGAAILSAGSTYLAVSMAVLSGSVLIATQEWETIMFAALGAALATPKILFSIIPTVLSGRQHLRLAKPLFPLDLAGVLIGVKQPVVGGSGTVGLGILILAAVTLILTIRRDVRRRWVIGVCVALLFGGWTVGGLSYYTIPGMQVFRSAYKALPLIVTGYILLAVPAIKAGGDSDKPWMQWAVTGLLILSAVTAGVGAIDVVDPNGEATSISPNPVVQMARSSECDDLWIEHSRLEQSKLHATALTKAGIRLQAVYYGVIGQHYATHQNGQLTFDALLVSERVGNGTLALTGGWNHPVRGQINTSEFEVAAMTDTSDGPVYLYAPNGSCS
jgi:hypothetical protein